MLVLLVGPKGSGKSHVGRVLERHLGVHFLHVEPLWMRYHAACKARGEEPLVPAGIEVVHPAIQEALQRHRDVCVETTGASPEILEDLLRVAPKHATVVVRVAAPLELCLRRAASRDQTNQIPMEPAQLEKVYRLSTAAEIPAALVLENIDLSDADIVRQIRPLLAERRPRLMRFPTAVPRDPAVEAWFEARPDALGEMARRWYEHMRACGDDVRELLHDGQPTACVGDAAFGYVDAFSAHVNVGFFPGSLLDDPAGLLAGTGKHMRHVKLRPGSDVDDAALTALIEEAYLRIKAASDAALAIRESSGDA